MVSLPKFSLCISTCLILTTDLGHIRSTYPILILKFLLKPFFFHIPLKQIVPLSLQFSNPINLASFLNTLKHFHSHIKLVLLSDCHPDTNLNFNRSTPCHLSSDHCKSLLPGFSTADLTLSDLIFA